jgi:hypothetical protein
MKRTREVRARKVALVALANLAVIVLLLALLEGAASLLLVAHEIVRTPAVPEHRHAEHDEKLGWVGLPDVDLPDFYGPGVAVRTNGQRFRNRGDFPSGVPSGKIRIICSGDSFTFGYGVGNDQVWCERLVALDRRLETVNMGMGGYGVDQAYLWYRRDGVPLDHHVQLFAFVTDDFHRMRSDRFMGYGKPLLTVRDDSLAIANLPVPETSWLARRRALHGESLQRLAMIRLARRVLRLDRAPDQAALDERDQRLRELASRVLADLKRINEAKGSRLVLVYLPGTWDYLGSADTDAWRSFVEEEAAGQGIELLDLVAAIRRVAPTEVASLFASNGHFSVRGNEWAARVVYAGLAPFLSAPIPSPDSAGALP